MDREQTLQAHRAYNDAHREEIRAKRRARYREHAEEEAIQKQKYRQDNREQILAQNKKYKNRNRERILTQAAVYRETNRDELNAKNRAYKADNHEKVLEAGKVYYHANKKERKAYNQEYVRTHRQWRAEYDKNYYTGAYARGVYTARRRARKACVESTLSSAQWQAIKAAFSYRCAYCKRKRPLEMDHVVPIVKKGTHTANNIVPACRSCNATKWANLPAQVQLALPLTDVQKGSMT